MEILFYCLYETLLKKYNKHREREARTEKTRVALGPRRARLSAQTVKRGERSEVGQASLPLKRVFPFAQTRSVPQSDMKHHHSPSNTYRDTLIIVKADRSPRSDVKTKTGRLSETISTKTEAPLNWSPDVGTGSCSSTSWDLAVLREQSSCFQVKMLSASSGLATGTTGVEEGDHYLINSVLLRAKHGGGLPAEDDFYATEDSGKFGRSDATVLFL